MNFEFWSFSTPFPHDAGWPLHLSIPYSATRAPDLRRPGLTIAGPEFGLHLRAFADENGQVGVRLLQLHVPLQDEIPAGPEERLPLAGKATQPPPPPLPGGQGHSSILRSPPAFPRFRLTSHPGCRENAGISECESHADPASRRQLG